MGPNFKKGVTRIGRERLPRGFVAILGDLHSLQAAISELYDYVIRGCPHRRAGIVFRVVSPGERTAYVQRLQRVLGVDRYNALPASAWRDVERHWHLIDSDHIAHIVNRHTDPEAEEQLGHVAVTPQDLLRIPDVINPRNLTGLRVVRGMTRLAYSMEIPDGRLVAVEELRAKGCLALKTLYKQK
jgi:hypothetical protein